MRLTHRRAIAQATSTIHQWPIPIAVALLLLAGCGETPTDAEASDATQAEADAGPKATNVETIIVAPQRFTRVVTYAGETRASHEVLVSAEASGRIVELGPDENDVVEVDQLVSRLDTRTAKGQISQARAQLVNAQTEWKRLKPLVGDQLVTPAQIERAEAQVRSARAVLQSAKTAQDLAEVYAPERGIVVERYKDVGEFAAPGERLLRLADLWTLKVDIHVPEDELRHLSAGMELQVRIPALGEGAGGTQRAKVHRIGFIANQNNRTFPVELHIDNESLALRAGMLVFADVTQIDLPSAIVVNRDAVLDLHDGRQALVVVDHQARARDVVLGPGNDDRVVIESGLEAGDELIVVGQRHVVDGDRVRVLDGSDGGEAEAKAPQAKPPQAKANAPRADSRVPPTVHGTAPTPTRKESEAQ